MITITVPDLSGSTDVDVVEVLVKDGDTISEGDSLIVVETDKASMDIPAPQGGVVVSVKIKEGDTINEGDQLIELETGSPAPAESVEPVSTPVATAANTESIFIPDLSGSTDVDVVEVLVKEGDRIAEGDSLIVLETDKASMEVPALKGGVIVSMKINVGDTVNEGDLLMELQVGSAPADSAPLAAAPVDTAAKIENIFIPDLSGSTDVDVVEVLVKEGDRIAEGDSLIVLETDKASMEVPSLKDGVIVSMKIKAGDTVNEGDLLMELQVGGSVSAEPVPATPVAAPAPVEVAATTENVLIPDLSGSTDVDVVEVLVKEGDRIAEGDSLIVLETDKASMEVPSLQDGIVVAMNVKEGDTVNEGDLMMTLQVGETAAPVAHVANTEAPAPKPAPAAASATSAPVKAPALAGNVDKAALEQKNKTVHAGPAVRALAREFGVDLSLIAGTGRRGRIVKEDVQLYVKGALQQLAEAPKSGVVTTGSGIPAIPEVDFSKFGEIEIEKLSKIAKVTRDNMSRCWLNIPHVTQFDKADITDLETFRKEMKDEAAQSGVKLTPMPFMLKAIAIALQKYPKFNASLHADGEHIVYKKYINIGIAVDTAQGLMVPVIKDADKKSIYELSKEAIELAGKAKDRKLKPDEMQGACFTISSLGGIGGTGFTPIVNAPEVAILGVSKADIEPRWNGKEFEPRKMLPLCLSYDHRAINGGDAGRFLTYLNSLLSDIRRLVL
ncbi:MAG: pyruvate dehydrogenase complex dihydrolipoyllysine-residue acetyltransferase [Neptuniibacter caesariensis]|uniref:Acetyltransferase component of pyruvate dehydrogenase complex n=1 Tax=Neptuniibacter caesariensis TaxID=207954 RepID=A0A2G6JKQ3_NEPCE|nr:MAG: pyruvate dehydrogenase complex dihydrolipoyllysine-residue acetyltransferase [Neptuniibacter caesariensis]